MVLLISNFIVILYASTLTIFYLTFYLDSEKLLSIRLLEPVPRSHGNMLRPTETARYLMIATSILLLIIYIALIVSVFFFPEIACNVGILMPFLGSLTYYVVMIIPGAKMEENKDGQLLSDLIVTGVVLLLLVATFKQEYVMAVFLQPFLEKIGANFSRNALLSFGAIIMFLIPPVLLSLYRLIFHEKRFFPQMILIITSVLCVVFWVVKMSIMQ